MAHAVRGIPIEAWTQETLDNLSTLHISAATVQRDLFRSARGPGIPIDIPIDAELPAKAPRRRDADTDAPADEAARAAVSARKGELARRDSQKRRDALLKGKEGSRRRQRWENDRLLGNPHVVPPEPHDWAPQPTYPVHAVPYYLAPLWDERKAQAEHARAEHARLEARKNDPAKVPRELRERLKKSGAAKGLLIGLEEQIREFVQASVEGKAKREDKGRTEDDEWTSVAAIAHDLSSGEEDDEIVFVGRNGSMNDAKFSSTTTSPQNKRKHEVAEEDDRLQRNKLVFDSLASDHSASFARFLVHSIATYYNLRTWSVTTTGNPARREAYVGIADRGDVLPLEAIAASEATWMLPRPLWVLV